MDRHINTPTGRELADQTRRLLRHVAEHKAILDRLDADRRRHQAQARAWAAQAAQRHVVTPIVGWRNESDDYQDLAETIV